MKTPNLPLLAKDHQHALRASRATIEVLQALLRDEPNLSDPVNRQALECLVVAALEALDRSHRGWGTSPDDTPQEVEARYRERYCSHQ